MVRMLAVAVHAPLVVGGAALAGIEREFDVRSEEATLGGTLTLPEGAGPHVAGVDPALLGGSGWTSLSKRCSGP